MAKTEILTKDGLTIYDEKIKDYIKEKIDDTVYIDPDEASSDLPDIDAVTSAKYVSYNNADSNLEATNVQEAIDELKESIGSGSGETVNIVDNLESTSADSALSANQGRVVNKKVDEVNTYLQRKPSKNLLKITIGSGFSELGVTFTVNEDKSLTLSGTRTGFTKSDQTIGQANLKAGIEYILSGCPEGGSGSTYRLMVHNEANPSAGVSDIGEGVIFTVPSDGEYRISTILAVSYAYDGITYYPMIREATVEDDTYEPYYEDAMTMVNHLNDNALVHGDIVDNLLSNRADLPLSANMGRELSETVNAHSERFRVIHEYITFSIVKMGKIVRLVGAIELTEITQAWGWIFDFRNIAEEYKPPHNKMIKDENLQYTFELNNNGYLQCAETIPAGVYYFDVAWLIL